MKLFIVFLIVFLSAISFLLCPMSLKAQQRENSYFICDDHYSCERIAIDFCDERCRDYYRITGKRCNEEMFIRCSDEEFIKCDMESSRDCERKEREEMKEREEKSRKTRGWLGVVLQPLSPELLKAFGLQDTQGALVADVMADGPAAKAGLQRGDVIVSFQGSPVQGSAELPRMVAPVAPGTAVQLEVLRCGQKLTIPVTLGSQMEDRYTKGNSGGSAEGRSSRDTVSGGCAEGRSSGDTVSGGSAEGRSSGDTVSYGGGSAEGRSSGDTVIVGTIIAAMLTALAAIIASFISKSRYNKKDRLRKRVF